MKRNVYAEQNKPVQDETQTYYGVYMQDGEFVCKRCKRVNPDMNLIRETPRQTEFRCSCGNSVRVEKR